MERIITPEILDDLSPEDPRAIRSRRDLLKINAFLGNARWVRRELQKCREIEEGIVELGAGDGMLCRDLHRSLGSISVTGLDFTPRPGKLDDGIQWQSGDFFTTLPGVKGGVCIGNLILHHFSQDTLRALGQELERFSVLVFTEPLRSHLPLLFSHLAWPFAGEVTRHDMPASIRAGFRKGELPALLGLHSGRWIVRETSSWLGSLRLIAFRRDPAPKDIGL